MIGPRLTVTPTCWAAPLREKGASKALFELLNSMREKEGQNNRGKPQHLKEEGRRR